MFAQLTKKTARRSSMSMDRSRRKPVILNILLNKSVKPALLRVRFKPYNYKESRSEFTPLFCSLSR